MCRVVIGTARKEIVDVYFSDFFNLYWCNDSTWWARRRRITGIERQCWWAIIGLMSLIKGKHENYIDSEVKD